MRANLKAIATGSTLLLLSGWLVYDLFGNEFSILPDIRGDASVSRSAATRIQVGQGSELKAASINPLGILSLQSLTQTIERPLFNASRVPKEKPQVQAEVAAVEQPAATAEDFTLLGIVVADKDKTALVRFNKTNEILRLKAGQSFSQWKLTEIQPQAVVIEGEDQRFPLKLFAQPGQPSALTQGDRPLPANPEEYDEDDQMEAVSRLNNG